MSDNFDLFLEQVKIYQEVERIRVRRKIIKVLVAIVCIVGGVYYYFY
jgi:hypothetical protein